MATIWINYFNGITTDKGIGDTIGLLLDPDPGATEAFSTPLRLIGSELTTPVAWFTACPMTAFGLSVVAEFEGPGPYPTCNAIGITNELVAAGQQVIVMEYGSRAEYEGHGLAFIAANGYEIIPNE